MCDVRCTGVLSVAGMDSKFVFQGVGMLFSGGFVETQWGADETREVSHSHSEGNVH